MSGYTDLRDLGVQFVPPDSPLPPDGGRYSPFSASWTSTVDLLADELRHLEAAGIAIELDMPERMFRKDGLPRADAVAVGDAVRLSFTSKWGPLRYETGEFTGRWRTPGWQANVRAIALAMEALRKVDRYGVSKRGEQYRGWRALPTSSGDVERMIATEDQARAYLGQWETLKEALRATHPDYGGDPCEFRKVMRAKELLGV